MLLDNTTQSVTQITEYLRNLLESDAFLQSVWVRGEVSNMTRASSGHWYFTLKDAGAQIKCVMWRSSAVKQTMIPRDGDEIEARGRVTVYDARGEYQLVAERVRPVGMGDLYLRFEELKARLAEEGLFDAERKRPIPIFPRRIGVVTSPDAAAFQDIQNVLRRRFPMAEILISPTQVQGVDAPPLIVAALERLYKHGQADVILLCRGGGSLEDLWCFNDERVARAVANSPIPVITGVGHETDFTIVDFVSDLRAPTPSAAAELATPYSVDTLRDGLQNTDLRMEEAVRGRVAEHRAELSRLVRTMNYVSPLTRIASFRQRIDGLTTRMTSRQTSRLALLRERLKSRDSALKTADPRALLARGYAMIQRSDDGKRVTSAKDVTPGVGITIQLHDGEVAARIEDKETHGRYKRTLF